MAISLGTLPPETINQILSNIDKSGWLLDVALTCRSLHELTIPHLYRDIKLVYHGYDALFPYLRPFVIRVLGNSELASHIRSFTLNERWGTKDDPSDAEGVDDVDRAVREVVKKLSQSPEEENEWIEDLKVGGDEDPYLCLLLASLPNLERLNLLVPELVELDTKYFSKIIMKRIPKREKPFDVQPALASLKVMFSNCDADKYGTSPDLLCGFLKLPSLQHYYSQKIGSHDDSTNKGLAQLETATSSLTHLEIRESKVHTADLTNILRACKGLRTLVYELGWGHISYCKYSTPELRQALVWTESTLENLWLDYQPGPRYFTGDDFDDLDPIGSLSHFKTLKNIRVGMYIFFGVHHNGTASGLDNTELAIGDGKNIGNLANILPPSLETLYFSHTNGRIRRLTRALEILLEQKASATPKLKRIAFEAYITGNDENFDFSRLDALAEEGCVGIDRIDGTALSADNGYGWEWSPGVEDRGRGMDGSLTWAAELATESENGFPVYVDLGM